MTVMPDEALPLGADFPAATREQWQQLVEGVLRKAGTADVASGAAEQALSTRLDDGVTTLPLYTAANAPAGGVAGTGLPGIAPFVRGGRPQGNAASGWDVRQRYLHPHAQEVHDAVVADLEGGVTSLWLAVGDVGPAAEDLPTILDGVYLDLAPVVLDAGTRTEHAARTLLALYDERGIGREAARGNLGADPLGVAARTGAPATDLLGDAVGLARSCAEGYPALRALTVDALPYHEAGASAAQELGCSLATGVAYLRALTAAGLPIAAACAQIEFRYAATADQFLTIAALRAARRLWARVAEACGVDGGGRAQVQHAVTSPVMMARRDPWVNMLRTTVACFAAGVGGADAVTVLPYDDAKGLPDAFSRRIARNTSAVLLEESHLARVIDPAGGSWYVEALTDQVARAAWAWFQEIERAGGMADALASGLVADRIAATWQQRSADLAHRREPITGVSEFPNLAEQPVERDPAPEPPGGGLPRVRRDDAFAALRARSDAHLAATGARPRVFLAALGPAAAHTARVGFAANLFRAGGLEPVHEPTTVDPATAAEAFGRSGAAVVCLCSSDRLYAEQAAPVAAALAGAGAARVLLAGRPGERRTEYEQAGVSEFVFTGGDAVAVLTRVLDLSGVA